MDSRPLYDWTFTAYDLSCREIDLGAAPLSGMVCEVPPMRSSRIHNHAESEVFIFLEGEGRVHSNGRSEPVSAGWSATFAPFMEHVVENVSRDRPLRMISLYWMGDPKKALAPAVRTSPALVFTTPPTPNGDLHLGHLSGPYLAADILRRALRQRGRAALHITGRDDNQTYVAMKAAASGATGSEICDRYAAAIRDTLGQANIPLDGFISPDRDGAYARFVQDAVRRLHAAGHVYAKRAPTLVGADGAYLHEAYVRGGCPHCGEASDGNACEACGRPNQCVDLIDPVDRRTGQPVRVAEVERLYFRFSAFADRLSTVIKETRLPARVFALAQAMIDDGLPDISISHPSPWGLPIGIEGFDGHVLYVWFEMAVGYLFGAARTVAPEADPWMGARQVFSGDIDIIHAYGFDNAYYHALLFPAVYLALDIGIKPPRTHLVNELLDLDGQKFSTSRNHVIWGRDLLAQLPCDPVRYGLARARPQGHRVNFVLQSFLEDASAVFGNLGGWFDAAQAIFGSSAVVPEPGAWLADHQAYYGRALRFVETLERAFGVESFAPHEAAAELREFVADSLRFARSQAALAHFKNGHGGNYRRTAEALVLLGLRCFAIMADPVLPETCARLRAALRIDNNPAHAMKFMDTGPAPDWASFPRIPQMQIGR